MRPEAQKTDFAPMSEGVGARYGAEIAGEGVPVSIFEKFPRRYFFSGG